MTTVPLLVNHDETRVIGIVRELTRFEDTDGPWLVALATVTDRPAWLKRGTRASFGYKCGRTQQLRPRRSPQGLGDRGLGVDRRTRTVGAWCPRADAARGRQRPILPVAPAGATVIAGNGQIIRRPVGQVLAVR